MTLSERRWSDFTEWRDIIMALPLSSRYMPPVRVLPV